MEETKDDTELPFHITRKIALNVSDDAGEEAGLPGLPGLSIPPVFSDGSLTESDTYSEFEDESLRAALPFDVSQSAVASPVHRGQLAFSLYRTAMLLHRRFKVQALLAGHPLTARNIRHAMAVVDTREYPKPSIKLRRKLRALGTTATNTLLQRKAAVMQAVLTDRVVCESPVGKPDPPYVRQGNLQLYSLPNLLQRERLKKNRSIGRCISKLWALCRSGGPAPHYHVTKASYSQLLTLFHRILVPDNAHDAVVLAVERDWVRDSHGAVVLGERQFANAMFEVADKWCEGMNHREYVDVLNMLVSCVMVADPDTGRARLRFPHEVHYNRQELQMRFMRMREQRLTDLWHAIKAAEAHDGYLEDPSVAAARAAAGSADAGRSAPQSPSSAGRRRRSTRRSRSTSVSPSRRASRRANTPLRAGVRYGRSGTNAIRRASSAVRRSPSSGSPRSDGSRRQSRSRPRSRASSVASPRSSSSRGSTPNRRRNTAQRAGTQAYIRGRSRFDTASSLDDPEAAALASGLRGMDARLAALQEKRAKELRDRRRRRQAGDTVSGDDDDDDDGVGGGGGFYDSGSSWSTDDNLDEEETAQLLLTTHDLMFPHTSLEDAPFSKADAVDLDAEALANRKKRASVGGIDLSFRVPGGGGGGGAAAAAAGSGGGAAAAAAASAGAGSGSPPPPESVVPAPFRRSSSFSTSLFGVEGMVSEAEWRRPRTRRLSAPSAMDVSRDCAYSPSPSASPSRLRATPITSVAGFRVSTLPLTSADPGKLPSDADSCDTDEAAEAPRDADTPPSGVDFVARYRYDKRRRLWRKARTVMSAVNVLGRGAALAGVAGVMAREEAAAAAATEEETGGGYALPPGVQPSTDRTSPASISGTVLSEPAPAEADEPQEVVSASRRRRRRKRYASTRSSNSPSPDRQQGRSKGRRRRRRRPAGDGNDDDDGGGGGGGGGGGSGGANSGDVNSANNASSPSPNRRAPAAAAAAAHAAAAPAAAAAAASPGDGKRSDKRPPARRRRGRGHGRGKSSSPPRRKAADSRSPNKPAVAKAGGRRRPAVTAAAANPDASSDDNEGQSAPAGWTQAQSRPAHRAAVVNDDGSEVARWNPRVTRPVGGSPDLQPPPGPPPGPPPPDAVYVQMPALKVVQPPDPQAHPPSSLSKAQPHRQGPAAAAFPISHTPVFLAEDATRRPVPSAPFHGGGFLSSKADGSTSLPTPRRPARMSGPLPTTSLAPRSPLAPSAVLKSTSVPVAPHRPSGSSPGSGTPPALRRPPSSRRFMYSRNSGRHPSVPLAAADGSAMLGNGLPLSPIRSPRDYVDGIVRLEAVPQSVRRQIAAYTRQQLTVLRPHRRSSVRRGGPSATLYDTAGSDLMQSSASAAAFLAYHSQLGGVSADLERLNIPSHAATTPPPPLSSSSSSSQPVHSPVAPRSAPPHRTHPHPRHRRGPVLRKPSPPMASPSRMSPPLVGSESGGGVELETGLLSVPAPGSSTLSAVSARMGSRSGVLSVDGYGEGDQNQTQEQEPEQEHAEVAVAVSEAQAEGAAALTTTTKTTLANSRPVRRRRLPDVFPPPTVLPDGTVYAIADESFVGPLPPNHTVGAQLVPASDNRPTTGSRGTVFTPLDVPQVTIKGPHQSNVPLVQLSGQRLMAADVLRLAGFGLGGGRPLDEMTCLPLLLRAQHTWHEYGGALAVHYVSGRALGEFDPFSQLFVDRDHIMWLAGHGFVFCRLRCLPPNRDPNCSEAFGTRVYLPPGSSRVVNHSPQPSARSRVKSKTLSSWSAPWTPVCV